jgi:N-dimethylarginine dimethylaminohydrolase
MTDRELMQMALDALEWCYDVTEWPANGESTQDKAIEALRDRLAQPEPQEIKIEFKEWVHPHMGLVPVDPKTPLILKAVIREEA